VLAGGGRLRGATLYSANVFGGEAALGLAAGADALVRALDWMAAEEVRFVNLSLAGPYNKLLDLAVERAAARGLILVAAVGNDGPEAEPMYPAGFSGVIAVTAVDANAAGSTATRCAARMSTSAAPGVDVLLRSGPEARRGGIGPVRPERAAPDLPPGRAHCGAANSGESTSLAP
jgi:minor extracellular protease Epr